MRAVTDTALITTRNVKHLARTPMLIVFSTIQPVMFTLLFVYVFGGAIRTPGLEYVNYLLPGILVQTIVFTSVYTGFTLNTDISKGIFERFRSMPVWRPAPIVGATNSVAASARRPPSPPAPRSGAGSALRSTLLFGVRGNASRRTNVDGTM